MADLKTTNIFGDAYINNKVGIATNAPATRLQIGQLSPTAATEGIQFGDDTNTRIYRGASGQINFNGTINVLGNTYLGDANGDTVFVNDTIRIGATDSGDASLFFGEGAVAGSDYGARWYWDSGYTFTWYTRNAGTDTALFDYVTNNTSYINWRRNFHMQNKEINYNAQIHFNAGTRFVGNTNQYLIFRSDSTSAGGIQIQDGSTNLKGYIGYWDSNGGGILNNSGNWAVRYNFGNENSGGTLYGAWTVNGNISAANLSGTNTGDQSIGNGTITIAAGTGIGVGTTNTFTMNQSGATTVTVTNSGVTSNVAGTGISVSGATGAVTITNSGVTSLAGTTNRITVSGATGAVTLNLPQDIHTGASPTFSELTLSGTGIGAYGFVKYGGIRNGNWQTFTDSAGEMNIIQTNNITDGNHSNYPTGVYGYGAVLSWRTSNHSFQLYAAHTGDLAYKTQWDNDNYSGWRRILDSTNYVHAANMNQYVRTTDSPTFAGLSLTSVSTTGATITNLTGAYQNTTVYDSAKTQSATPSRGIRAPASSIQFTDSYAIAPFYTYRSTGDWPVPYGIGWGTGGESSGIFQRYASNGSSFGDMIFYTGNDGFGAFSFRRHTWEGTAHFAAGSGQLNTELFRIDWAGNISMLGTLNGSANSATFYANNGSYGAWAINGTRNGWGGIEFANNGVSLMMGSDTVGFHQNTNGWLFRVHNGSGFIYKGSWGGGTAATILDSSNQAYAWAMNQYVRTSDVPTFSGVYTSQIGINDGGMDCYINITDSNPTFNNETYGGEFYFYGDKDRPSSLLYVGGIDASRTIIASAISSRDYTRQLFPNGGYYHAGGSQTGAIKIKMYTGSKSAYPMLSFTCHIYNYSTGTSRTFKIGGHYSNTQWYNVFAYCLSDSVGNLSVRFGYEGTNLCVWIGETNSGWSYPTVFITDFQNGYSAINGNWMNGWTISLATAFDTVTNGPYSPGYFWNQNNDGAGSGLDADLVDGYGLATAGTSNTIVLRDSSGHITGQYILGSYFNASAGNSENPTIGQIWTQNTSDNYLRKSTPAHFRSQITDGYYPSLTGANASGTWSINVTGNAATVTNGIYTTSYYTGTPLGKRRYRIHSADSTSLNSSISSLECGFTYGGSGEPTGPFIAFGGLGGAIDYSCQLVGAYSGGNDFKIRTRNDDTSTWNAWRTLVTDGNYTSYSPSLTGTGASGTWAINVTGNATTATTLQTARNINGTSFNGSAAITTATWGTARTITIGSTGKSVDGSANVSWTLAEIGAAATNQTMFIGTTSVAINRASAAITLTGTSIDGNAATATSATSATNSTNASYQSATGTSNDWTQSFQQTPAHATSFREMSAGGPAGTWWMLHNFRHSNNTNYWGTQVAWGWEDNANTMYTRNVLNGAYGSWVKYINSANYTDYTVTKTGTGASGNWAINITGNAATATTATNVTIANGSVTLAKIENITAYTILGNSNASAAATPAALSVATVATMLSGQTMNINGSSTSCSGTAANATTAGGLAVHTGTNNEANKIVRTQGNGYIMAGWINTISGDNGTTAIDRVYASSDGYIRYYTPANFRTVLDVPTRAGSGASGNWAINITGNAATATSATSATTATNVAASGITGQTGMWTSAARPGPYRLYRNDHDSAYNLQLTWQAHRTNYWSLRGYLNDTFHAECFVVYSGYADEAGALTIGNTYRVANLGINVAASNKLHINGDNTNPAIRIDNGALVTGVASNSKNTFQGYLPVSFGGTTYYIRLWT